MKKKTTTRRRTSGPELWRLEMIVCAMRGLSDSQAAWILRTAAEAIEVSGSDRQAK